MPCLNFIGVQEMLRTHLLSKASTFTLMGLFASVVITPCAAMEPEDKETLSAPTLPLKEKTSEEMKKEKWEIIQEKASSIRKASEEKIMR
jgi:hypothetical protein